MLVPTCRTQASTTTCRFFGILPRTSCCAACQTLADEHRCTKGLVEFMSKQRIGLSFPLVGAPKTPFSLQVQELTHKLGSICFPTFAFQQVAVFKGCFGSANILKAKAESGKGFVVMWKHAHTYSLFYVSAIAWADIWKHDNDSRQWCFVLY